MTTARIARAVVTDVLPLDQFCAGVFSEKYS